MRRQRTLPTRNSRACGYSMCSLALPLRSPTQSGGTSTTPMGTASLSTTSRALK